MSEGSWIFLSHSHKDFDKVREVRNILEEKDHNPLMFFLKCLSDDDEIDDLITREIEARSWFILCDSENARSSSWVQQEIEIIKGYPEKTYAEVNLDDPNVDIEKAISQLTRKASIFLTYTRHDHDFANRIKTELKAEDFGVFSALEMLQERDGLGSLNTEMRNIAQLGAILLVLSTQSVKTVRQNKEVEIAGRIYHEAAGSSNVILIYRDDPAAVLKATRPKLRSVFEDLTAVDFSTGDFNENMTGLMRQLRAHQWSD